MNICVYTQFFCLEDDKMISIFLVMLILDGTEAYLFIMRLKKKYASHNQSVLWELQTFQQTAP